MAKFDSYRRGLQDRVNSLYGDDAAWTPLAGGAEQVCKVLLNLPSGAYDIEALGGDKDGWVFNPLAAWFEYAEPDFEALEQSVRDGEIEVVEVKGVQYNVTDVKRMWDGATLRAKIEVRVP